MCHSVDKRPFRAFAAEGRQRLPEPESDFLHEVISVGIIVRIGARQPHEGGSPFGNHMFPCSIAR
jgi:hypothetical protein